MARTARFLSEAAEKAFRAKLTHQQHVMFEFATAMADVETAVELTKAAASGKSALLSAQARLWAGDVAMSVPVRLLTALVGSGAIEAGDQVALRMTVSGTHRGEGLGISPTGKPIRIVGVTIGRYRDGLLV